MQPQTAHFSFKIQQPKNPTFWQTCQNHGWNFGLSPNLKSKNAYLQKIQNSKWHLHEQIGLLDFGSLQEWCLLVEHCYFRGSTALLFRFRLKTLEVSKLHRREGLAYSWVSPGQKSESQRLSLNAKQNRGHRREGVPNLCICSRLCSFMGLHTCMGKSYSIAGEQHGQLNIRMRMVCFHIFNRLLMAIWAYILAYVQPCSHVVY